MLEKPHPGFLRAEQPLISGATSQQACCLETQRLEGLQGGGHASASNSSDHHFLVEEEGVLL